MNLASIRLRTGSLYTACLPDEDFVISMSSVAGESP